MRRVEGTDGKDEAKMEISEKEYFELKEQVRILQEKIGSIEKPKGDFSSIVAEMPITFVRNSVEDYPDFEYVKGVGNAWNAFIQLAKIIHTPSWKFYMDSAGGKYDKNPYIRTIGNHQTPRKIANLTNEQILLSVQMLNEMIPIFNKYFKQTHEFVLYSDRGDGQYRKIYVERELPDYEIVDC